MKTPKAPDPYKQANAQAGANRDAAISGSIINNIDESSPFGSVTYTRGEDETYIDSSGKEVTVPRYRRDVTLSEEQQALYDRQTQAGKNLGDLAVSQSARLNDVLNEPFDPKNLPDRASSEGIRTDVNLRRDPDQMGFNGPAVQHGTQLERQKRTHGYSGPGTQVQSGAEIRDAGPIQRTVGPADYSKDRDRVEDAVMSRYDRLDKRSREAAEAQLINQGLTPGSNAWNARMEELDQSRTDARMQAILAGGQEQSRLAGLERAQGEFANNAQQQQFGQNQTTGLFALERMRAENAAQQQDHDQHLSGAQFERQGVALDNQSSIQEAELANRAQQQIYGQHATNRSFERQGVAQDNQTTLQEIATNNDAVSQKAALDASLRQQALQEEFALRNQPINEISGLMSGAQVTAPQFSAPYRQSVQAAPVGDYIQQNYQSRLNSNQGLMSGLFGLGSSVIQGAGAAGGLGGLFALSDRRLKDGISLLGKLTNGLGLYLFRYRYNGQWSVGVMAQEAMRIIPNAVRKVGGVMSVNYGEVANAT